MPALNKWMLLSDAVEGVADTNVYAAPGAVLSHYGFRSSSLEQWHEYRRVLAELGQEHVTYKADGRQIVFVGIGAHVVGNQRLRYLELPQPVVLRNCQQNKPPDCIAVYTHSSNRSEIWESGYDIRHVGVSADEIIAATMARG